MAPTTSATRSSRSATTHHVPPPTDSTADTRLYREIAVQPGFAGPSIIPCLPLARSLAAGLPSLTLMAMSPDRHVGVHGQPVPEEASLSVQPSRLGPVYRKERMAGRGPQQYSNCRDLREIPDMDNITHSGTTKGPLRCREAWAWPFKLGESSSACIPQ